MKKSGILSTLTTAFGLSAMATAAQAGDYMRGADRNNTVTVRMDVGGYVNDWNGHTGYTTQTAIYNDQGTKVRIEGQCRSACTTALGVRNVCVTPGAQLKFHKAYNEVTRQADDGVTSQLMGYWPAAVQAEVNRQGGPRLRTAHDGNYITLSGAWLNRYAGIPLCGPR